MSGRSIRESHRRLKPQKFLSEIKDLVREVLEEPEMQRLMIETVHAVKMPKRGEPCTLKNLGFLSPHLAPELSCLAGQTPQIPTV